MKGTGLSRRGFLQHSLSALAAAGLPAWYAREVLAAELDQPSRRVAANDKIQIGVIGTGDRFGGITGQARGLLSDMKRHQDLWKIVAVADVDKGRRETTAKTIGGEVAVFEDFRELLQKPGIDAVVIATPDHWHTIPALAAAKAKKDMYCEKPMTLTIAEGKVLTKMVRDNKVVFQVGSQQRSDARFRLACELVRNGRLGKIETVETRIGGIRPEGPFKTAPVPAGLNWDFWLGQAPKVEYIPQRCHYQFRWWYDYSGGKMTDWGAHHNDIAQWALGTDNTGPVSVESKGEQDKRPNCYDVHSTFDVTYKYATGVALICKSGGENGVHFKGEKGWIFVSRGKIDASDKKLLEEPLPATATKLYVSNNHFGNFFECVKSRKDPICSVDIGHRSVSVCHLGTISLRLGGKSLKWNPAEEKFEGAGADEGNAMVSRKMRAPWKLEA